MTQAKPTATLSANTGRLVTSEFSPPWWARNRHVQTLWPRYFQRRKAVSYRMQRLTLPDKDFVDLAFSQPPDLAGKQPRGLAVIFHGLEGSVKSHYANDLMAQLHADGWQVVVMHFRGCSGEPNTLPRAYHSGETGDARYVLEWLAQRYPHMPRVAIGFSLGGNMLLKLLGEEPQQPWLQSAVSVSAPLRLDECASSIDQGFSRIYQRHLLKSMNARLKHKMGTMDYQGAVRVSLQQVDELATFWQFDDKVTAPLHGFAGATDYYRKSSAIGFLSKIATPTLILHAIDDPFMSPAVVPEQQHLSPAVTLEVSERGGHVGFVEGPPWNSQQWFIRRISRHLKVMLA